MTSELKGHRTLCKSTGSLLFVWQRDVFRFASQHFKSFNQPWNSLSVSLCLPKSFVLPSVFAKVQITSFSPSYHVQLYIMSQFIGISHAAFSFHGVLWCIDHYHNSSIVFISQGYHCFFSFVIVSNKAITVYVNSFCTKSHASPVFFNRIN